MSQPTQDGPADAVFMCDKAAMLGDVKRKRQLRQLLWEVGY